VPLFTIQAFCFLSIAKNFDFVSSKEDLAKIEDCTFTGAKPKILAIGKAERAADSRPCAHPETLSQESRANLSI
jgi:hypothetical protein